MNTDAIANFSATDTTGHDMTEKKRFQASHFKGNYQKTLVNIVEIFHETSLQYSKPNQSKILSCEGGHRDGHRQDAHFAQNPKSKIE